MIVFAGTVGIPLVFLHGFLGRAADWEPVCSRLPSCHCIGVDLPGHGSSLFSPNFDFALPASKFHLIGYSMGERIALQYALRYPGRIAKLLIAGRKRETTEERCGMGEAIGRIADRRVFEALVRSAPLCKL